jgi:hypothetical protein
MLATVVDPLAPAVVFLTAALSVGWLLSRAIRRVWLASLIGSSATIAVFILLRWHLPMDFWAYAQDLMYEPLLRDVFHKPAETAASALFHLGLPYGLLVCLKRLIGRETAEKRAAS